MIVLRSRIREIAAWSFLALSSPWPLVRIRIPGCGGVTERNGDPSIHVQVAPDLTTSMPLHCFFDMYRVRR
jgi:hypothetical protein